MSSSSPAGKSGRRRSSGSFSFRRSRKYSRRASSDSKVIPRHSTRPESRAADSRNSLGPGSLFAATFILPALEHVGAPPNNMVSDYVPLRHTTNMVTDHDPPTDHVPLKAPHETTTDLAVARTGVRVT